MATTYRTRAGDVLDAICFAHYGRESAVSDVLEANPHLAELGPVFESGIIITLPVLDAKAETVGAALWD